MCTATYYKTGDLVTVWDVPKHTKLSGRVTECNRSGQFQMLWIQITHIDGLPKKDHEYPKPIVRQGEEVVKEGLASTS